MSYQACRVSAPKYIKSCSIRNESRGDIQVRVTYANVGVEPEGTSPHQREASLSQGATHQAEPRIVSHEGCEYNSHIQSIEVTLADGQQLQVEEPFEGVTSIQPDWLFAVNDHGIKSLPAGN